MFWEKILSVAWSHNLRIMPRKDLLMARCQLAFYIIVKRHTCKSLNDSTMLSKMRREPLKQLGMLLKSFKNREAFVRNTTLPKTNKAAVTSINCFAKEIHRCQIWCLMTICLIWQAQIPVPNPTTDLYNRINHLRMITCHIKRKSNATMANQIQINEIEYKTLTP